jgi:hypothetical protein
MAATQVPHDEGIATGRPNTSAALPQPAEADERGGEARGQPEIPSFAQGYLGPSLHGLVEHLKLRQRQDRDNLVIIDGYEGGGKSNCGLYLARLLDPGFDAENVIFDWEDWLRPANYQPGATLLLDEGGNLGFNRDWNVLENKEFVKYLMQSRQQTQTVIMCIPNFHWLDKYIRAHRAQVWIHMESRSRAVPLTPRRDWLKNELHWRPLEWWFTPPDVRRVLPDAWQAYERRKHEAWTKTRSASLDRQGATHGRARPAGSLPTASNARSGSHPAGRPLTAEEKSLVLAKTGRSRGRRRSPSSP